MITYRQGAKEQRCSTQHASVKRRVCGVAACLPFTKWSAGQGDGLRDAWLAGLYRNVADRVL